VPPLAPRLPAECRTRGALGESAVRVDCGAGRLRGGAIAVPGLAGTRVDAVVRVTWNDGAVASGVLRNDGVPFVVPEATAADALAGAPVRTVARHYLALGVVHILGGWDHLLFVIGLFLLVGTTRRLVATVTAFTVAHSLTLAAAVLGVVALPAAPVEALIAASIVLLARELAVAAGAPAAPPGGSAATGSVAVPTPVARVTPVEASLTRRFPWVMAFLFGLLHGLGFAGALAESGVPADHVPAALLAFNLGVEAGQLGVVAVLLGLAAVRPVPRRSGGWVRRLPAYAMGTLAAAWTLARILAFWQPVA
jgi:hypothetical protein